MRHDLGVWKVLWSDTFIESTFLRYGQGKKDITGVTP